MLEYFEEEMKIEFYITDPSVMKYFLGIEIQQSTNGIFVGQQKHAIDIIQKFRMTNCKPDDTQISQDTKMRK